MRPTQFEVHQTQLSCLCSLTTSNIYCVTFRAAREPLDPKEMMEMLEIQDLMWVCLSVFLELLFTLDLFLLFLNPSFGRQHWQDVKNHMSHFISTLIYFFFIGSTLLVVYSQRILLLISASDLVLLFLILFFFSFYSVFLSFLSHTPVLQLGMLS